MRSSLMLGILLILLLGANVRTIQAGKYCDVQAKASCTITDNRKWDSHHTIGPPGSNCRNNILVNKTLAMTDGYPDIQVNYTWSICNMNINNGNEIAVTKEDKSWFKMKNKEIEWDKTVPISAGECREKNITGTIKTEKRSIPMSTKIEGRVKKDQKLMDGADFFCFGYKFQRFRVKYTEDCNVVLDASCTIDRSGGRSCEGNIVKVRNNNGEEVCKSIPVTFAWKYCSLERLESITTQASRSKMKLDGTVVSRSSDLLPNECKTFTQRASISTCSEKTWASINFFGTTNGTRRECQNYDILRIIPVEAMESTEPSPSPSLSPSWISPKPIPLPTKQPFISSPSIVPKPAKSVNPSKPSQFTHVPSSKPSDSHFHSTYPTVYFTSKLNPSSIPSTDPSTVHPSLSTPHTRPIISNKPSSKLSRTPSMELSSIPTSQPSSSPSKTKKKKKVVHSVRMA